MHRCADGPEQADVSQEATKLRANSSDPMATTITATAFLVEETTMDSHAPLPEQLAPAGVQLAEAEQEPLTSAEEEAFTRMNAQLRQRVSRAKRDADKEDKAGNAASAATLRAKAAKEEAARQQLVKERLSRRTQAKAKGRKHAHLAKAIREMLGAAQEALPVIAQTGIQQRLARAAIALGAEELS